MRTTFFLLVFMMLAQFAGAQTGNLVVFSDLENGSMKLLLNGKPANTSFLDHIRLEGLPASQYYKMKIVFEDSAYPAIEKDIYLSPATEKIYSVEKRTYTGRRTYLAGQGPEYYLNLVSETGIDANVTVVNREDESGPTDLNIEETPYVSPENPLDGDDQNIVIHDDNKANDPCSGAVPEAQFQNYLALISSKAFESNKYSMAEQFVATHQVHTGQVKAIMKVFALDRTRVKFAKFAYDHTCDKADYVQVTEAIKIDTYVREMLTFIEKKKK